MKEKEREENRAVWKKKSCVKKTENGRKYMKKGKRRKHSHGREGRGEEKMSKRDGQGAGQSRA
jgi:hypothetical protein